MTFARTGALVGLAGLGLCLLTTGPVRAGQSGFVSHTIAAFTPAAVGGTMGTGNISADCTFNGKFLGGKVKIVDSFPDIRVKAVASFPDLKVKQVQSFADGCGEWQFVDSFPDFKIQYVDSFPDIEIAWVDSFPGMP
jgi:hypothetical protein